MTSLKRKIRNKRKANTMNVKEMKMGVEAEYKARSLYIELVEASGGDNGLLIQGLSKAMNIIKTDLVALLPPAPKAEEATPTAAPAQATEIIDATPKKEAPVAEIIASEVAADGIDEAHGSI